MRVEDKLLRPTPLAESRDSVILRLLEDRKVNSEALRVARERVLALERRDELLCALVRSHLDDLPDTERDVFIKAFPILTPGPAAANRSVVLNAIVSIFASDQTKEWSTPDLQSELSKQGIHAESKRIFNTLNYLASDHRITRVLPGRYRASPDLKSGDESETGTK